VLADRREPPRVGGRVDRLQAADADVGVDLRRGQLLMAQDLLEGADVRPMFQHQGRHRVPEQVAGTLLLQARPVHVVRRQPRHPHQAERTAPGGQEQGAVVLAPRQPWPGHLGVGLDPGQRPVPDGDHPILAALALPDHDAAPLEIHVPGVEVDQFRSPHPRAVEGLQDGLVPQADEHPGVGQRQHGFRFPGKLALCPSQAHQTFCRVRILSPPGNTNLV